MTPVPRSASVLLLCVALVAVASIVAFAFATTVRSAQIAGRNSIAGGLARSAARMGARHVLEILATESVSAKIGTGEWPLVASFDNLERNNPANHAPDGSHLTTEDAANPFDGGDNVPADDSLQRMFMPFVQDQGYSPTAGFQRQTWAWPWPYADSYSVQKGAILNHCVPRWVEPGFYASDMAADPVRFTAADPAASPVRGSRPLEPIYYDSRWQAVDERSQARYRLRYAVAAIDLGGHFRWGRQLGYSDNTAATAFRDLAAATALRKNPAEWDMTTAAGYLPSLQSIVGKSGLDQKSGELAKISALFLGLGSVRPANATSDGLLVGFTAGARPGLVLPAQQGVQPTPGYWTGNGWAIAAASQGGVPSWQAGQTLIDKGTGSAGYWMLWSCSPFGRGNEFEPGAAKPRYYQGPTDCPWRINLLTAPPETIQMLIQGLVPQVALKASCYKLDVKQHFYNTVTKRWEDSKKTWEYNHDVITTDAQGKQITVTWGHLPRAVLHRTGTVDALSTRFHPRSMQIPPYSTALAASGRSRLFDGFTAFDYLRTPDDIGRNPSNLAFDYVAGTSENDVYDRSYPGPKEEWEDYARLERHPQANVMYMPSATFDALPMTHAGATTDFASVYRNMLGARITAFHHQRDPYPCTGYDPALLDYNVTYTDISTSTPTTVTVHHGHVSPVSGYDRDNYTTWTNGDAYAWSRTSVLDYGLWSAKDPNGADRWYSAMPFEPMRGSGSFIARRRTGEHDWRYVEPVFGPNSGWSVTGHFREQRRYYFRDSYWMDLMTATGAAITTAKALYQKELHPGANDASRIIVHPGAAFYPAGWKPTTVRDIDALFLSYLGEWHPNTPLASGPPAAPGTLSTPPTFCIAKRLGENISSWHPNNATNADTGKWVAREIIDYQAPGNIAMLHHGDDGTVFADAGGFLSAAIANPTTTTSGIGLDRNVAWRKTSNMERVLNDWRMSLFGANPEYPDFRPLDFNGDGYAVCSAYGATALNIRRPDHDIILDDPAQAPPATRTYTPGDLATRGILPDRAYPSRAATAGIGPRPDIFFSVCGFLAFDKIRFARVIVRGEVFDTMRQLPIASADLDTVLAIDPDGDAAISPAPAGATGLRDSEMLYQRWLHNYYTGNQAQTPE